MKYISLAILLLIAFATRSDARTLEVGPGKQYARLQTAAANAQAGDTILFSAGVHAGGDQVSNLQGTPEQWITIRGDDNEGVIISGGGNAFQLSDPAFLRIEGLVFEGQTGNGVNIDDGGSYETPAHDLIIENCEWRALNASGNNDQLKLSGLDEFVVRNCRFVEGAAGGSAIDMVGCHQGVFEDIYFKDAGSNCIQAKGGTSQILIQRCRMINGGERSVNIGGSTGLQFFRPLGTLYEASEIYVYSNVFEGSTAPIAFVGAINCEVINNTMVRPTRWAIRILQETTEPGFVPCGQNTFANNIVIFNTTQPAINVGGNTAPETFTFTNNLWFNPDNSSWSGPNTPVQEPGRVLNVDPMLFDSTYRITPTSPAVGAGASLSTPSHDFRSAPYLMPRSIGAHEGGVPSSVDRGLLQLAFSVASSLVQGELTIRVNSRQQIKIVDLRGSILWEGELALDKHIDVKQWPTGAYFIHSDTGSRMILKQ